MWSEKLASRRLLVGCTLIAGAFLLSLVAATWYVRGRIDHPALLIFWWVSNGALIYSLYPLTRKRRRPGPGAVPGRVVAVVGVHEQNEDDLRACIWSILNQVRVVVGEIHVVDDGSTQSPVQPFPHPRVRWHRKANGGKRAAQRYVLDRLDPADWDFVLAVDGNCVLDEHAIERQLREFAEPNVMATTAMVAMRNARQNMITRLVDLNTGTRAIRPAGRSVLHAVQIAPGAVAVYRAGVLFEHERRALASAADGDDHCLATYPPVAGEVPAVPEAIAWTRAPAGVAAVRRQLLRSATAWWRVPENSLTGGPARGRRARLLVLLRVLSAPAWVLCGIVLVLEAAGSGTLRVPWLILYATLYLLVRYARTGLYLTARPGMERSEKLRTWVLLTPVEAAYNLLGVGLAKYLALLPHRALSRSDREQRTARSHAASVAEAGTTYYSGYMSERTKS